MLSETGDFKLFVKSTDHFYQVVRWMNNRLGAGSSRWLMRGRPLHRIKRTGRTLVTIHIAHAHRENFDLVEFLLLNS